MLLTFLVFTQIPSALYGKAVFDHVSPIDSVNVKADDPWNIRVSKAWEMLLRSPCKRLQYGENCTGLKSRAKSQMNVYTADKEDDRKTLTTVLVEKLKGNFKHSDAVLVLDPYPDAHFGHTVIVFLIEFVRTSRDCSRKGSFFTTGKAVIC